ncbi:hypothetical protein R6Q57_002310 [Mikania cordata]
MAHVARSQGGDGGNEPPYGPPYNLPTGCESCMPHFTTKVGKKSLVRSKCPSLPHYITTLIFNNITTLSTGKALSKRIVQTVIRIEKQSSKNILTCMEVMITLKEQRQNPQRAWNQMLGFELLRSYLQLPHTRNGPKQTQQIV